MDPTKLGTSEIPAAIRDLNEGSKITRALRKKPKTPSRPLPDEPNKTEQVATKVYNTRSQSRKEKIDRTKTIKVSEHVEMGKEKKTAEKVLKNKKESAELDPKVLAEEEVRKAAAETAKEFAEYVDKGEKAEKTTSTEKVELSLEPPKLDPKYEDKNDLSIVVDKVMECVNKLTVAEKIPVEGDEPKHNEMVDVLNQFKNLYPDVFKLLVNIQSDWNYYQMAYVSHQVKKEAIGYIPDIETIPERTKKHILDFITYSIAIYGENEETLEMVKPLINDALKAGLLGKEFLEMPAEELSKKTESLQTIRLTFLDDSEKKMSSEDHLLAKLSKMKTETDGIGKDFSTEDKVQLMLRTKIEHAANPGESETCKKALAAYDHMHEIKVKNSSVIHFCEAMIIEFHKETRRRLEEQINSFGDFEKIQDKIKNADEINGKASYHKDIRLKFHEMGRQCSIKIALETLADSLNAISDFRGTSYTPFKALEKILLDEAVHFDIDQVYEDIRDARKNLEDTIINIKALRPISVEGRDKIKKDTKENPAPTKRLVEVDANNPKRLECAESQNFLLKVLVGGCVRGLGLMSENVSFNARHAKIEKAKANFKTAFQLLERDHAAYLKHEEYQKQQVEKAVNAEIARINAENEKRKKELDYSTDSKKPTSSSVFSFWG